MIISPVRWPRNYLNLYLFVSMWFSRRCPLKGEDVGRRFRQGLCAPANQSSLIKAWGVLPPEKRDITL